MARGSARLSRGAQVQNEAAPMVGEIFEADCDRYEALRRPKRNGGESAKTNPIKLTFFDECSDTAAKRWLIKGVIAFGETSSWIAPPGRGKSALHSDISVHLAADINWRGHMTKGRVG